MNSIAHLKHEATVGGISNALFNGVIAWLLLGGGPALAWGGAHSFAVDIVATSILLPFIVALIVIPMQRKKMAKGELTAIDLGPGSRLQNLANRFPTSTFKSALMFALVALCVIAPLTLLGFKVAAISTIEPLHYVLLKALWTGVMAAVIVLPMVLVALRGTGTHANAEPPG